MTTARRHLTTAVEAVCAIGVVLMLVMVLAGRPAWLASACDRPRGDELLLAGIKGNVPKWVEQALAAGACLNARDQIGMTPLMWAAQLGDEKLVRRLIDAGADVVARSPHGMTALAAAAGFGQTGVLRILIGAGAAVDQPALLDGTALHFAAAMAQVHSVELLIAKGSDPNGRTRDGQTPLMLALHREEQALEVVRRLVQLGANVNLADHQGQTALMIAASDGQRGLVDILLDAGADPFSVDADGDSAASLATRNRHLPLSADLRKCNRGSMAP